MYTPETNSPWDPGKWIPPQENISVFQVRSTTTQCTTPNPWRHLHLHDAGYISESKNQMKSSRSCGRGARFGRGCGQQRHAMMRDTSSNNSNDAKERKPDI